MLKATGVGLASKLYRLIPHLQVLATVWVSVCALVLPFLIQDPAGGLGKQQRTIQVPGPLHHVEHQEEGPNFGLVQLCLLQLSGE